MLCTSGREIQFSGKLPQENPKIDLAFRCFDIYSSARSKFTASFLLPLIISGHRIRPQGRGHHHRIVLWPGAYFVATKSSSAAG